MNKNTKFSKLREWIQDNFFSLIIFLVLTLLIILIVSLFIPINVNDFPTESIELERYNAGVERRTILIRSISSLISGISVIIAFVSLLQSKTSEEKRERMQVIPFPAYAVPLDTIQDASASAAEVTIKQMKTKAENVLQTQFDIRIKNIGLGSLVDFEVVEAYYWDKQNQRVDLDISFKGNFILGKEETIRLVIKLRVDSTADDKIQQDNLKQIRILATFNDLLGHRYAQEFTIESEIQSLGQGEITRVDGSQEKGTIYSLEPQKITHNHPYEY